MPKNSTRFPVDLYFSKFCRSFYAPQVVSSLFFDRLKASLRDSFKVLTHMVTRREFLKTASLVTGAAALLPTSEIPGTLLSTDYFGLNDFIESHPDAVFVFRTAITDKTDTAGIKNTAYQFGKNLFIGKSDPSNAFPLTANVVFKPNITSWSWDIKPIESTMGIQTDPNFVEGIIQALKDLSLPAANMYIRDANYSAARADGQWYHDLATRTGVNLKEFGSFSQISSADL